MTDHDDEQPDEPVDPVERRNAEDEAQALEWANIDLDLERQQEALEQLMHDDPLGVIAFGDSDGWLDKRLRRE
jgi:hypothetical protein